jgi:hypothetical protein
MCVLGHDGRADAGSCDDVKSAVVRLRRGGLAEEIPACRVSAAVFPGSVPWRTFRWRKGQAHYPGAYWSAVMGDHLIYESRLELAFLLFADRDPGVRALYSQPFQLSVMAGGKLRRHVPDFLVAGAGGALRVVDVKPLHRLGDAAVAFTFGWTGQLAEGLGWQFEVFSEPEPGVLANVRFLAGYRRGWQFDASVLEAAVALAEGSCLFADLERAVSGVAGSRPAARAHLLHLLWSGLLRADLGCPLSGATRVERGR